MLSPDAANREKEIFERALDIASAEERLGYVRGACGQDGLLLARIEALLHADETGEDFLPEAPLAPTVIMAAMEKPGDRIGRYKLLQQIGEGGCGVVYMAEQTEPVRRRVALKVIKLGMDTRQVVARFEAERQALALMDHPNVAKVLDAGATDTGRPFFVMELVRGIKITDFCDQSSLSTSERLNLFVQVCRAIEHAHQKGVIHRDIKPSNILVTINDGVPVPKVIDFGIAKATAGPLTDKTLFTAFEQFIGTPAYMSPEQAVMTSLDIDTRSDIYSLGVLLYELLTGKTPFDGNQLMASGLDEMRRTIRDKEPMRPSTRLTQELAAAGVRKRTGKSEIPSSKSEIESASSRRLLQTRELIHRLRGDLDWVVMKCLEKDRRRRYETANGLATDIQRHLDNEPVVARPPSTLYRLQKLVRRNKLGFAAGAAIASTLVFGIVASTWQAIRATSFRTQAQGEARRAESETLANRQNLYAADMNLANQALENHNLLRARELLEKHRPPRGKPSDNPLRSDLRGWEWRYLSGQCRSDELATLGRFEARVGTICISPDGKLVAAACDDGLVRLWDLRIRQPLASFETYHAHPEVNVGYRNHAAVFSPDGSTLASGGINKEIILWDVARREKRATLRGHTNTIGRLVYSPDGKLLASASQDQTARLWDMESGREIAKLEPHLGIVLCVAFSPDGRTLVTSGEDKPVKVWDISNPRSPRQIGTLDAMWIESVVFSPDGTRLAGCGSNESAVRMWEFPSLREIQPLRGHAGMHNYLAFSSDGRRIASAGGNFCLGVWDLAVPAEPLIFKGHENDPWAVTFAPDDHTLISGGEDGTVRLWDVSASRAEPAFRCQNWVHAAAFSRDSKYAVVLTSPDHLIVWDVAAKREAATQAFSWSYEGQIECSPNDKTICVSSGGRARFFELPTLRPLNEEAADRFLYGPEGRFAVVIRQGEVLRRDFPSGRETSLGTNTIEVNRAALSPNGETLAVGGLSGKIALWNTRAPGLPVWLTGHTAPVYGLAFSPDGERLASASWDSTIGLWDTAARRNVAFLRGHAGGAWDVAFSPDRRTLASSANDETVMLWNLASLQQAVTLHGHNGSVSAIAFSPDGKHLVSAGGWTVRLWQAPTFEEIASAGITKSAENK